MNTGYKLAAFIGVDTGNKSGAIAIHQYDEGGEDHWILHSMPQTEQALADLFRELRKALRVDFHAGSAVKMAIEKNASYFRRSDDSMPFYKNSVTSSLSHAQNAAFLRAMGMGVLGLELGKDLFLVPSVDWMNSLVPNRPRPPDNPRIPKRPEVFANKNRYNLRTLKYLAELQKPMNPELTKAAQEYFPLLERYVQECRRAVTERRDHYQRNKAILAEAVLAKVGLAKVPKEVLHGRSETFIKSWGYADAMGIALWLETTQPWNKKE